MILLLTVDESGRRANIGFTGLEASSGPVRSKNVDGIVEAAPVVDRRDSVEGLRLVTRTHRNLALNMGEC